MVARAADPNTSPGAMAVYAGTDYIDPDNFLWAGYHSSQAGTWSAASHYQNPDFDALLEQARSSTDEATRLDLYTQAQQKLVDDAVEVWVFSDIPLTAWVPELTGNVISQVMGGDLREFGYATGS
jgi:peptide/nickel transport system substrate-binding protein